MTTDPDLLQYRTATVYFVYSATWDASSLPGLEKRLLDLGWINPRLHERALQDSAGAFVPAYQPNLVTKSRVWERARTISRQAEVLAPIEEYSGLRLGECRRVPVQLDYTIRLFMNGGAVCTFAARIRDGYASLENIHSVLRLAANVDRGREPAQKETHLASSYLQLPDNEVTCDRSLVPTSPAEARHITPGRLSLHDLFRRAVWNSKARLSDQSQKTIPEWCPVVWLDEDVIDTEDPSQDFQTPFVVTIAEIPDESFARIQMDPSLRTAKEIASIACKLTLDNRYILRDYLNVSEDYIRRLLPFNEKRDRLANLCLDERLFFTTSRRGAIALTTSLSGLPSFFVVPSLVNLLEILRVRWHLSSVVSTRLDLLISQVSQGGETDTLELLRKLFLGRAMFGAFLRDPVPLLFDGGSVADVAEIAEKQHWLPRLRTETARKLECLEKLVSDHLNVQRWEELAQTDLTVSSGETVGDHGAES